MPGVNPIGLGLFPPVAGQPLAGGAPPGTLLTPLPSFSSLTAGSIQTLGAGAVGGLSIGWVAWRPTVAQLAAIAGTPQTLLVGRSGYYHLPLWASYQLQTNGAGIATGAGLRVRISGSAVDLMGPIGAGAGDNIANVARCHTAIGNGTFVLGAANVFPAVPTPIGQDLIVTGTNMVGGAGAFFFFLMAYLELPSMIW